MQVEQDIEICNPENKMCRKYHALFDTGAMSSFIDEKVADELGNWREFDVPREVDLAVKGKKGILEGEMQIRIGMDGCRTDSFTARVMKDLARPVVIGATFMEEFGIELDMREGKAHMKQCPPRMLLI